MDNQPVEYVIEPLLGEVWRIFLFPDGHAHAEICSTSDSQHGGSGPDAFMKTILADPGTPRPGGYLRGEHPMTISKELADKMREILKIEDAHVQLDARESTDQTLIELWREQVAEKIKNRKK
jgi:hypothetical protein